MSELPPLLVNGLIAVVALALFVFFWWAVRDLPMWFKYLARFGLTVLLVLPVVLVWVSMNEMPDKVGSAAPPPDMNRDAKPPVYKNGGGGGPPGAGAGPPDESHATSDHNRGPAAANGGRGPAAANGHRGPAASNGGGGGGPPPTAGVARDEVPPDMSATSQPKVSMAPEPESLAPGGPAPEAMTTTPEASAPSAPSTSTTRSLNLPDPAVEEEEKDWTVIPIFYGTDRAQKTGQDRIKYDWNRGRRLELGRALVTIPSAHVVPMVERPWALKIPILDVTIYEEAEDPKRHFTMKELKALSRDQFLALVRERLGGSERFKDHALIFVHGYKTKFDNAIYRTAQIAHDLKFDGAPFLYSWPSGGTLQGYTYDRTSAEQAEPYLQEFLKLVSQDTGAKKLSVIAHSMGNQVLLRVLQDLNRSAPDDIKISQLILAAPDVDRDSFVHIVRSIRGIADGITLYAAANDAALQISRTVNGGEPRAGDVPEERGPIVVEGIDTIDATATSMDSLGINHAGYAENNALLADIRALISTGTRPPDQRQPHLMRVDTEQGAYWKYPDKIE